MESLPPKVIKTMLVTAVLTFLLLVLAYYTVA